MNDRLADEATTIALTAAMHDAVGSAVPPASLLAGLPGRAARERRQRRLVTTTAVMVVVIVGVAGAAIVHANSSGVAPPIDRTPSVSPSPPPVDQAPVEILRTELGYDDPIGEVVHYGLVLLPEVRGRGSRTLGPVAVSAAFKVRIFCSGLALRVQIRRLHDDTYKCDGRHYIELLHRPDGVRSITITVSTDKMTAWSVRVIT